MSDQELVGLDGLAVRGHIERWKSLAEVIAKSLGCRGFEKPSQKKRVFHYYLPTYFWVRWQLTKHQDTGAKEPCVIGISAPQGCGKTTLVTELERLLAYEGVACASVSIDDFYLTHADQSALAQAHPENGLLQGRGHAGTHDIELGTDTLQGLTAPSGTVKIPRYNKSAFGGAGDRAAPEQWQSVELPVQVVLFEGWMLGFNPVSESEACSVDPSLQEVNSRLGMYKDAWDAFVHAWLVVEVGDVAWVYNWRLEAEHKMKAEGQDGMSDEQVQKFVSRYMPAYTAYLPELYAKGPTTAKPGSCLFIQVDDKRCLLDGRTLQ